VEELGKVLVDKPFPYLIRDAHQKAEKAYQLVLENAGASFARDEVDRRVVEEVRMGESHSGKNANGIIDSQTDVGGWPILFSGNSPGDKDEDGMPDEWERKHGLNPANSDDAAKFDLDKEYTNVEVYLNSLVE